MARKTITVAALVTRVNRMLAVTDDAMREERKALSVLLESVLMDTDNYRGFSYLSSEFIGGKPENGFRDGYDGTRRKYFGGEWSVDNCPTCGRRIGDFNITGREDETGQRHCAEHPQPSCPEGGH